MYKYRRFPLDLQFFAAAGDPPAGDPPPAGGTPPPATPPAPPSFDDFLKNKDAQSEFDKRVAKALETAKGKWDKEASLTAEEKAAAKTKEREDALNQKESEITKRELRAKALETLGEKGLPKELVDTLDYADEKLMNASLASVEKVFRASLAKAVDEKLKGNPPPAGGGAAKPTKQDVLKSELYPGSKT
jgi:hypothetical protein